MPVVEAPGVENVRGRRPDWLRVKLPYGETYKGVVDIIDDKKIIAIKNVSINEPQFTGHFPDTPIFPGVLIVEAMAQASGILAFKTRNRTLDDGYIYYLAGTDKTKFKSSVVPGDQLRLEVEIVRLP